MYALADAIIPPPPSHYFNDYANVVSPATASRLNTTLANYERESSDQIVVAIFPYMQSDEPIKDYTKHVANAWGVGQKGKNNGVALFVFIKEHEMQIQVGKGLETALPDAVCKKILDEKISPRLHLGDFNGGLSAGVTAIIAVTKGAYRGNGKTNAELQIANTNEP